MIIIQHPLSEPNYSNQTKLKKPIQLNLPGSKYIANRVLLLASLATGKSTITNCPMNEDINQVIHELRHIAEIQLDQNKVLCIGNGLRDGRISFKKNKFYTHDNGTFTRFILSLLSLGDSWITLAGSEQMRKRPMGHLVEVLMGLGVQFKGDNNTHLPLTLKGPLQPGSLSIKADISSQFISSLLMALPLLNSASEINLKGKLVSYSYLKMTIHWMQEFGVKVRFQPEKKKIIIPGRQSYRAKNIIIPSDVVSASYFIAGSAMTKQDIWLGNFDFSSQQGEVGFVDDVDSLGIRISKPSDKSKILKIYGSLNCRKKTLERSFNYQNKPDVAQTLLVMLNAISFKKIIIKEISHLRYKETNRVENMARELKKVGINIKTTQHSFVLKPHKKLISNVLDSHHDHRMAMSLSLLAACTDFIALKNEMAINKSFPDYYTYLEKLGFIIKPLKNKYRRLILIGFRGVGKSTIAKNLAKKLKINYFSSDNIFETEHGAIHNFVKQNGWNKFRRIETSILKKLVKKENVILDLGGGIVETKENWPYFKSSLTIYLSLDYHTIRKRLNPTSPNLSRPQLPEGSLLAFKKRLPLYESISNLSVHNYDKKKTIQTIYNLWDKVKG